ncbi:MAG: ion transporter [Bacillota bacterium]|nr:ion transporter [Bacillota bacterium]
MENEKGKWDKLQTRLFNMVSVGVVDDPLNQSYDIVSTVFLVINLIVSFLMTFDNIDGVYHGLLHITEAITVAFFALDYVLRILTADKLYINLDKPHSIAKYIISGYGIIDLLSFLPFYLPIFFPAGAAVFRMFRVVRIFRLFRINTYYDSLNVIGNVLNAKKTQILASLFIIIMLLLASSLCMYSVEHEAQPQVFANALSGLWWATSTMFTVGYGDIYPVTVLGKLLGIIITFLGVGLVALPTGIISAGFVEEYQKVKRISDIEKQSDVHFIETEIKEKDKWVGKKVMELGLPRGTIIASIIRETRTIIPKGEIVLKAGDRIIICAQAVKGEILSDLKEIVLKANHSWNGMKVKDLDISRQTFIVLVERNRRMLVPEGNLVLRENDKVLLYTKDRLSKYTEEPLF